MDVGRRVAIGVCAALLGVAGLFGVAAADAAEVKVLASVAIKAAFDDLLAQFERASGHTVSVQYSTTAGIKPRIEGGERFDVVVASVPVTDELVKSGRLLPEPRPVVGVTVAALAYKNGTPRPEIATDEALKATLLGARAISLSDPGLGGASSNYFMRVIQRLGLEAELKNKLMLTKPGEGAAPVGTGTAQYGVALTSEVAGVPGVSGVPIFPSDPASSTVLAAAVSAAAAQPEAGRALIAFLLSPEAVAVRKAKGLVPE